MKGLRGQGSITVDFIFGMTAVAGVSMILLALCLTMAVVEISQYMAFSASRSYFSGHLREQNQITRGETKYGNLIKIPSLRHILTGEWFKLSHVGTGDFRNLYPGRIPNDNATFFGTRLQLRAEVLNIRLPFLGSSDGEGYSSFVASYMGREPTFEECMQFTRDRWTNFSNQYPVQTNSTQSASEVYAVMADNGC